MTLSTERNEITAIADGVQTVYPYDFRILDETDLDVVVNGLLVDPSNYTVQFVGEPTGGTVTFQIAPADGVSVIITRTMELTQETDYKPYDPFPAETHETALDRLTMICQQLEADIDKIDDIQEAGGLIPVTAIIPESTNFVDDVNAFDFTGHQFSDPANPTQLKLELNHVVTMAYGEESNRYAGFLPRNIGLGASPTSSFDWFVVSTNIASVISYIPTAPRVAINVQDAIDEVADVVEGTHITTGNYTASNKDTVFINGVHIVSLLAAPVAGNWVRVSMIANSVGVVEDDGAAEVGTYYAIGDGALFVYDGASWQVFNEVVSGYGKLAKTVDQSIGNGAYVDGYASNFSEVDRVGNWFNAGNSNLEAAFAALLEVKYFLIGPDAEELIGVPRINGTSLIDHSTLTDSQARDFSFQSYQFTIVAGQDVDFFVKNPAAGSQTFLGNANNRESFVTYNILKRIRS